MIIYLKRTENANVARTYIINFSNVFLLENTCPDSGFLAVSARIRLRIHSGVYRKANTGLTGRTLGSRAHTRPPERVIGEHLVVH